MLGCQILRSSPSFILRIASSTSGESGHADEVYILAVAPEAQGRGIGHLLLGAGLQQMRDRGTEMAILYVDAENHAAIALYRRSGYVEVEAFNSEPYAHHWFEKIIG